MASDPSFDSDIEINLLILIIIYDVLNDFVNESTLRYKIPEIG